MSRCRQPLSMEPGDRLNLATEPATLQPQGQVLRGQYRSPLRSDKGKIKGLILDTADGPVAIKLPKYLRPLLVRELVAESWVQVWALPEDEDRWRAINLMPWPDSEVPSVLKEALGTTRSPKADHRVAATGPTPVCIQVCRKGKCFKQGGAQIWSALQAEVAKNPDLQHIAIEATGCMKACKQGPNLRVLPQQKMHSRVTPDRALVLLADYR